MKILKVIHGYPPRYNAGSEVYSQLLCRELASKHHVHVFSREENPYLPNFSVRETQDEGDPRVQLNLINIPLEKFRYQYQIPEVDCVFKNLVDKFQPDIVHLGHLNHLSSSLINQIPSKVPIVYTLHDYWLMCPRGQFIQRNACSTKDVWQLCDSQDDKKCAAQCYSGYFSGNMQDRLFEVNYWTRWIQHRMSALREVSDRVDLFIAPSRYLMTRFIQDYGLDHKKITYLDYGFNLDYLKNRKREKSNHCSFGYIGTHTPGKGINLLLEAFASLKSKCQLKIWGRSRAQNTDALQQMTLHFPSEVQRNIFWCSEYRNENIVEDVFNHVDCIIVPSIWVENSPLVIHEALQMRVPVITANIGGMSEYVKDEINGLLFAHRDPVDLAKKMQRFIDEPQLLKSLSYGYLQSLDGNIPSIHEHVEHVEKLYENVLYLKSSTTTGAIA